MDAPTILTRIVEHIEQTGRPPTIRTMALLIGCSIGTAHNLIAALQQRGYIEYAGSTRSITLTQAGLQHIGRI
jgi:hypothetical protein